MKLFKLTFHILLARKAWVVALFCVGAMPFILPVLVPSEFALGLVEPARAQAAWVLLWVVGIFWLLGQAARQGEHNVKTGVGTYFHSMGQGSFRQLAEIWLAHAVILVPLTFTAVLVSSLGAAPSGEGMLGDWVVTNIQYGALFLLVMLPLLMLALALGSRFGSLVGYLTTVGLSLYGLYGVGYLEVATKVEENELIRFIYAISPQYHLADLTEQLVFRMGALDWKLFLSIGAYLMGLSLITLAGSLLTYRTTAKA
jgi:hypothetical protein